MPVVVSIWLSKVSSFARGDLGLLGPIESVDLQLFSVPRLRLHLSEIVFRDGEDHRDRLHLRDHDQRIVVPLACTTFPGSTSRSPTRPLIGAVIWQKPTWTLSYCTVP